MIQFNVKLRREAQRGLAVVDSYSSTPWRLSTYLIKAPTQGLTFLPCPESGQQAAALPMALMLGDSDAGSLRGTTDPCCGLLGLGDQVLSVSVPSFQNRA